MIKFIIDEFEVDRLYSKIPRARQIKIIARFYGVECKYNRKRGLFLLKIKNPVPLPFNPCYITATNEDELEALQMATAQLIGARNN